MQRLLPGSRPWRTPVRRCRTHGRPRAVRRGIPGSSSRCGGFPEASLPATAKLRQPHSPVTAFAATASPAGRSSGRQSRCTAVRRSAPRIGGRQGHAVPVQSREPCRAPGLLGPAAPRPARPPAVGTAARSDPRERPFTIPRPVSHRPAPLSAAELPPSVAVAITNPLSPKSTVFMQQAVPRHPRKISTAAAAAAIRGQWLRNTEIRVRPESQLPLQPRPSVGRGCHLGAPERAPHYVCPVFILFHNLMCLHIGR